MIEDDLVHSMHLTLKGLEPEVRAFKLGGAYPVLYAYLRLTIARLKFMMKNIDITVTEVQVR